MCTILPCRFYKISGTLAFVQAFLEGMYIFDISSPDAPLLSGDLQTADAFWAIAVAGTHAYVPGYDKILAVNVANPHPYDVLGRADIPDYYGSKVALDRGLAYVTGPHTGLHIMDVSDPAAPSIIGNVRLSGSADNADIVIRYGYAYPAYGDYTFVVRVEDPAHPINVRNLDMDGCRAQAVALRGIYLYILDTCDRLWVADVSSPPQAHLLDHIWMNFRPLARDFVLVGRYAYAAGQEIVVIDLSNPVDPVVAATSTAPATVAAVAAAGSYLYLLGVQNSFCIMDISNPLVPIRRGCIDLPSGGGRFRIRCVCGGVVRVSDRPRERPSVNVSNPDDPRIVGSMTDVDDTYGVLGVSVGHDYVYQLDANRLEILPRECEPAASPEPGRLSGSPALVASPQPSSGETTLRFSLSRSAEARIDILDAAGRRVRSLHESAAVAGTNRVIWDGKDDGGRDVGSGIYFVRLRWGDRTEISRLIIAR
jgi:hypothetical protein